MPEKITPSRRSWRGKSVLITSGPTREHLDPVRFLTNASSGRMGMALAADALRRGARVTVVSGPAPAPAPRGAKVVDVVSAKDMYRAVMALAPKADVVIGAAAVGDYAFAAPRRRKLRRGPGPLTLTLKPNPDIIAAVGRRRRRPGQVVAGFALETHDLRRSASAKLERKGLDVVVANSAEALEAERSRIMIFSRRRSEPRKIPLAAKSRAARAVLDAIEEFFEG